MLQLTVLIPVNRLDRAKGRLAALLEPEERAELVRRSLATVLEAVVEAGMEAVVLTADEGVRAGLPEGVRSLAEEPELRGLSAQLESASRAAGRRGAADPARGPATGDGRSVARAGGSRPRPRPRRRWCGPGTGARTRCCCVHRGASRWRTAVAAAICTRQPRGRRALRCVARTYRRCRSTSTRRSDVRWLLADPAGRESGAGRYLIAIGVEGREALGEG